MDGVKSIVREEARFAYPGVDLDEIWSSADVDAEDWGHTGQITLVQVEPGRLVWIQRQSKAAYVDVSIDHQRF